MAPGWYSIHRERGRGRCSVGGDGERATIDPLGHRDRSPHPSAVPRRGAVGRHHLGRARPTPRFGHARCHRRHRRRRLLQLWPPLLGRFCRRCELVRAWRRAWDGRVGPTSQLLRVRRRGRGRAIDRCGDQSPVAQLPGPGARGGVHDRWPTGHRHTWGVPRIRSPRSGDRGGGVYGPTAAPCGGRWRSWPRCDGVRPAGEGHQCPTEGRSARVRVRAHLHVGNRGAAQGHYAHRADGQLQCQDRS